MAKVLGKQSQDGQRRSVLVTCLVGVAVVALSLWAYTSTTFSHLPGPRAQQPGIENLLLQGSKDGQLFGDASSHEDSAVVLSKLAKALLDELQARVDSKPPRAPRYQTSQPQDRRTDTPWRIYRKRGLFSGILGGLTGGGSTTAGGGGLLGGLGGLLGGGGGASAAGGSSSSTSSGGSGIEGLIGNLLSGAISDAINGTGILGGLVGDFATPAMFLGTGIGNGVSDTVLKSVKSTQSAAPPMQSPSGFDSIAENLGYGLSSSIGGNLNTSALLAGGVAQIPGAAFSLAQGLGTGGATSLKLSNASIQPSGESSISAIAGNFGLGLSSGALSGVDLMSIVPSGTQQALLGQVAQAIGPAGVGLGQGAAQGLKLTASSSTAGANPSSTSFSVPDLAQSFTSGLSSSFLGSVDISKVVTPQSQQQLFAQISAAVPSVGKGLGEGAAQGLKLTNSGSSGNTTGGLLSRGINGKRQLSGALSGLHINQLGEDFSKSLSSSFLGSVDISKIITPARQQAFIAQAIGSANSVGKGLGEGAAQGLGLANGSLSAAEAVSKNGTVSIPNAAQDFTRSLSAAFLGSAKLSSLSLNSIPGFGDLQSNIGSAAEGLGKGLGGGAAVGLGLQNPNSMTAAALSMNGSNAPMIEMVTQMFGQGLTQSFLSNGTLPALQAKLTSMTGSMGLGNINISSVAGNLASGLVGGAGQVIQANGGLSALTGSPGADKMTLVESPSPRDTVGQAAFGFGQGLGSSGVGLVLQLFGNNNNATQIGSPTKIGGINVPLSSNVSVPLAQSANSSKVGGSNVPLFSNGSAPLGHPTNSSESKKRRSTEEPKFNHKATTITGRHSIVARDALTKSDISDALNNLNSTAIDNAVQTGVNDLTCEGIGGMVGVLLGLVNSGTLQVPKTLPNIPLNQTFQIQNDGNTFTANLSTKDVTVNGSALIRFVVILGLHVFFGITLFLFVLPAVISLEATREVFVMMGRPSFLSKVPRWTNIIQLFVVPPILILTVVLGIAAVGDAANFRTAHEILGLVLAIQTVLGTGLHYACCHTESWRSPSVELARQLNTVVLLLVANATVLTGFSDLSSVSLCATQAIPFALVAAAVSGLMSVFAQALGLIALKFLVQRLVFKAKKNEHEPHDPELKGHLSIGEPVPVDVPRPERI